MGAQIVNENVTQMDINISRLRPSPLNTFELGNIDDLKGNILSFGLLTPPSVVGPHEDGTYEILGGERRYHALTEIHSEHPDLFNEIPCYICGTADMSQLEKQLIIESSNLETREFDKNEHRFHILSILKQLQDQGELGHQELVQEAKRYMKCSDRYRRMYMKVFNNDNKELNQLISDKKITIQLASRIAGLDEEKQQEAINRVKNGERPKDVVDDFAQTESKKAEKDKNSKEGSSSVKNNKNAQTTDNNNSAKSNTDSSNMPYGNYKEDYGDSQFTTITSNHDISAIDQAFFGGKSNIDPQLDTVGGLTSSDNDSADNEEKLTKDVIRWCNRMIKKTDFTDLEEQAFEKLKEVLDYVSV